MISLMSSRNLSQLHWSIGTILFGLDKFSFRSLVLGFFIGGDFVRCFGTESKYSVYYRSRMNDTGQ